MAETRGLVQRFKTDFRGQYWIDIGPTPTNTTLFNLALRVNTDPQFELPRITIMAAALNGALFARREVIVFWDEQGGFPSLIQDVEVVPG
jgi:hypothetical protein